MREILDAVFYVVRGGCAWRLLPHDFPPRKTVYHYSRARRIDGTWERLHEVLRRRTRVRLGRDPQPSAGIVDSQGVKTTGVGGGGRGLDPGKKVRGRERHLLADTEGLLMEPTRDASLASLACGWTRATTVGGRARTGPRRCWD